MTSPTSILLGPTLTVTDGKSWNGPMRVKICFQLTNRVTGCMMHDANRDKKPIRDMESCVLRQDNCRNEVAVSIFSICHDVMNHGFIEKMRVFPIFYNN